VNEVAARKSVSVLESISASVCWHCAEVGKPSTFEDKQIMLVVRGMKAWFCRPAQPRLPFTRSHMRKFMDIGRRSPRLWRAAVILLVCFADFLRFSEVAFVRLEDVTILEKKGLLEYKRRRITVWDSMCVYLWTRSGAIALVRTLLSTLKKPSGGRRGVRISLLQSGRIEILARIQCWIQFFTFEL
jgi:integrase